jgi:hypothetical protein
MTYNPNADRQYWRFSDSRRLIEAARESGHELCIALGERLDDWRDVATDNEDLRDTLRQVRLERDSLLRTVAEYEAEADK